MSIAFLLTTLVVVATPGAGVVYTLSAALARGRRAAVLAAFAATLGIVPHVLASVTGLAALLQASAVAFQGLKLLGVAYLLYLAVATWRDRGAVVVAPDPEPRSVLLVLGRGILLNLLNPKLTIFFFAFLPQFVPAGSAHAVPRMLGLSGVFMAATFVVFSGYGVFAASVRSRILGRPRVMAWLRRTFAGSFVALGATLAADKL